MDRDALQEKAASGRTAIVLGFAVLFAYLFSSRFTRAGTFAFAVEQRRLGKAIDASALSGGPEIPPGDDDQFRVHLGLLPW